MRAGQFLGVVALQIALALTTIPSALIVSGVNMLSLRQSSSLCVPSPPTQNPTEPAEAVNLGTLEP
jgi:hypothetical protein